MELVCGHGSQSVNPEANDNSGGGATLIEIPEKRSANSAWEPQQKC